LRQKVKFRDSLQDSGIGPFLELSHSGKY
jgi:hypothetical protein